MACYLAGQYEPETLRLIINLFYEELRSSRTLGKFFVEFHKAKRKEMSVVLLDSVLGNAVTECPGDIRTVHERMKITKEEYQEFTRRFLRVSARNGIDSDTLAGLQQRLGEFEDYIVSN